MYASELQLTYDNEKQKYIGEFTSVGGVYKIEGVGRADVSYEMERLLELEHNAMVRNVPKDTSYSKEKVAPTPDKPKNNNIAKSGPERGLKVYNVDIDKQKSDAGALSFISKASTWIDIVTTTIALSTGNFLEATVAGSSLALGEWNEGIESTWKAPQEQIFSVIFCGIVIKAKSKGQLRKKLLRQKNRRIQMIMMHLRKNGLVNGSSEIDPFRNKNTRKKRESLKLRKQKAAKKLCKVKRKLAKKNWRDRVSPQGRQLSFSSRSTNLHQNLKSKKEKSVQLWASRV